MCLNVGVHFVSHHRLMDVMFVIEKATRAVNKYQEFALYRTQPKCRTHSAL